MLTYICIAQIPFKSIQTTLFSVFSCNHSFGFPATHKYKRHFEYNNVTCTRDRQSGNNGPEPDRMDAGRCGNRIPK